MSRHWQPDEDRTRWAAADGDAPPAGKAWPQGATAGLLLVAAGCLTIGALFYKVAGPRYAIEKGSSVQAGAGQRR